MAAEGGDPEVVCQGCVAYTQVVTKIRWGDERVLAGAVREAEKQKTKESQIKWYVPYGRHGGFEMWSVFWIALAQKE